MSKRRWNSLSCLIVLAFLTSGCAESRSWISHQTARFSTGNEDWVGMSNQPAQIAQSSAQTQGVKKLKNPLALARLSERRGQTEQAMVIYQEVAKMTPENPVPIHRLGILAAREGKLIEATKLLERAYALAPSEPELLGDLGYLYYLRDMTAEAEQTLRRAVQLDSSNTVNSNNLAIVIGEQGRYDESLELFRRAGDEAQAQSNLAFIFSQRGEYQKAIDSYSRALTENPKLRPAAEALVQLAKQLPASKAPLNVPENRPTERVIAQTPPSNPIPNPIQTLQCPPTPKQDSLVQEVSPVSQESHASIDFVSYEGDQPAGIAVAINDTSQLNTPVAEEWNSTVLEQPSEESSNAPLPPPMAILHCLEPSE